MMSVYNLEMKQQSSPWKQSIIFTPEEGQTSSLQSEMHADCLFDIHETVH